MPTRTTPRRQDRTVEISCPENRFVAAFVMSSRKKPSVDGCADRPQLLWLARGFALVAFALATYSASIAFGVSGTLGCGPSSDCRDVLRSTWACWLGVPVGLLGAISYLSLFITS